MYKAWLAKSRRVYRVWCLGYYSKPTLLCCFFFFPAHYGDLAKFRNSNPGLAGDLEFVWCLAHHMAHLGCPAVLY